MPAPWRGGVSLTAVKRCNADHLLGTLLGRVHGAFGRPAPRDLAAMLASST